MKTKVLATAMTAVLIMSASAFASNSSAKKEQKCTCTECKECPRCTAPAPDTKRANRPGLSMHFNPFEGIELSEQQQAAIKALPSPQAAVIEALKNNKKDKKDKKDFNSGEINRTAYTNYLNSIKQILTPEQYIKFLENTYTAQVPASMNGKREGRPGGRPEGRPGNRPGGRPDGNFPDMW